MLLFLIDTVFLDIDINFCIYLELDIQKFIWMLNQDTYLYLVLVNNTYTNIITNIYTIIKS